MAQTRNANFLKCSLTDSDWIITYNGNGSQNVVGQDMLNVGCEPSSIYEKICAMSLHWFFTMLTLFNAPKTLQSIHWLSYILCFLKAMMDPQLPCFGDIMDLLPSALLVLVVTVCDNETQGQFSHLYPVSRVMSLYIFKPKCDIFLLSLNLPLYMYHSVHSSWINYLTITGLQKQIHLWRQPEPPITNCIRTYRTTVFDFLKEMPPTVSGPGTLSEVINTL
jgi:hypothetical protein